MATDRDPGRPLPAAPLDPAVRAVLVRAKERVVHGWCQHAFARGESFCLVGAIGFDRCEHAEAANAAWDILQAACGKAPSVWNDRPGRTQADVIALLDKILTGASG